MCELCKSKDGCEPIPGARITDHHLTKEDWSDLYKYMRYSYLPFVHAVILRAKRRQEKQEDSDE